MWRKRETASILSPSSIYRAKTSETEQITERNRSNRPFPYSKSPHFKKARPCVWPHLWKWISFAWESYQRLCTLYLCFQTEAWDNLELADKRHQTNNINWIEANQLVIYNLGWGFEQIQLAVKAGIEPRVFGLQVQRTNRSATLPPTLVAPISAPKFQ